MARNRNRRSQHSLIVHAINHDGNLPFDIKGTEVIGLTQRGWALPTPSGSGWRITDEARAAYDNGEIGSSNRT